jgi:hypothetical protein
VAAARDDRHRRIGRHLRPLGLATGEAGFNCDFHAIRHHGADAVLEKHYVPRRSQRTRAVLTFFAQDHASSEMVYANADITKTEQASEIIAFADYWNTATGATPDCWSSTPSSPTTRSSTSSPTAASPGSRCVLRLTEEVPNALNPGMGVAAVAEWLVIRLPRRGKGPPPVAARSFRPHAERQGGREPPEARSW